MSELELKQQHMNVLAVCRRLEVSKAEAVRIVGGELKLERLIESGKLSFQRRSAGRENAKYRFNLGDVLRFAKCMYSL